MNKGFYITSTFDINIESFELEEDYAFRKKSDLLNFPDVLNIYKPIHTETAIYFVNKLGNVIAFQFISDNLSEEEALEIYTKYSEIVDSHKYYEKLLKSIENTFGEKREPFSISNISIDLFPNKIKWDHYRIEKDDLQYFLECSFIFALIKSLHINLLNSEPNFNSTNDFSKLLEQSKNLFCLEHPKSFLISESEMRCFRIYYDQWDLSTQICDLKERYKLSIINYNHYNNIKKSNSGLLLNLFAITITCISLLSIVPLLSKLWPNLLNEKTLTIFILVVSFVIICIAIYSPISKYCKKTKIESRKQQVNDKMINNKI